MIEFVKKEDLPAILPVKRGRDTKLRIALLLLEIGDGLILPTEDWKRKNTPAYVVHALKKSHGRKFEYGMKSDGSGWLFRRLS